LFIIGGEQMRPYYPQGGLDPEHDKKFPEPYLRTHAAIDEISLLGDLATMPKLQVAGKRDEIAERVGRHITDSTDIEASRIHIAKKIAQYYSLYNLDPKE